MASESSGNEPPREVHVRKIENAPENKDHGAATIEEVRKLEPGARHYRAYVGSPKAYDVSAATQFTLMAALGLREHHTLLDIGCGSLCAGRLFIPYLLPGGYYGIEPQAWLVEDGLHFEVGEELRRLKRPSFRYADDFSLTSFNALFDFMLAQSVLTHVSQTQLDRCLSQAKLALKPEGLFVASFFSNGRDTYSGDDWIYPRFASYPLKFVVERARQQGLHAYPLIWKNGYDHYWMVFAHDAHAERVSWLGDLTGEQRMLRILELTNELNSVRRKYTKTKEELKEASSELSKSRRDKPSPDEQS
ncbi:MAG: class I SAM-dependent methyltransferase [Candidatus Binataceae bacterium]